VLIPAWSYKKSTYNKIPNHLESASHRKDYIFMIDCSTLSADFISKTYLTNMLMLDPTDMSFTNTSATVSNPSQTRTTLDFESKSLVAAKYVDN
jgi:hypothetical protein